VRLRQLAAAAEGRLAAGEQLDWGDGTAAQAPVVTSWDALAGAVGRILSGGGEEGLSAAPSASPAAALCAATPEAAGARSRHAGWAARVASLLAAGDEH